MTAPRLVALDAATFDAFRAYAAEHGPEHDESFVDPRGLTQLDAAETGCLLLDREGDRVVGVASLMPPGRNKDRRLRVIHARDTAHYAQLADWVRDQVPGTSAFCFVNLATGAAAAAALTAAGAHETRRTLYLSRALPAQAPGETPGMDFSLLDPAQDAEFVKVWREAYEARGGRTELTVEMLRAQRDDEEVPAAHYVGLAEGRVVATGRVDLYDPEEADIGTLAVVPDMRGRGLARRMLRELAAWAAAHGATRAGLSVDQHNDNAAALYLDEGYAVEEELTVLQIDGEEPTPFEDKPTLRGELVTLRPIAAEDADTIDRMIRADPEIGILTGSVHSSGEQPAGMPIERLREIYGGWAQADDRLVLAVVDNASGAMVGEVVLNEWDEGNRSCNFRTLIGKEGRGRGLGTEATRLVVRHALTTMGLHRVSLEVYDFNPRARHVYEKVGFVHEGTARDALWFDGAWVDAHRMAILGD